VDVPYTPHREAMGVRKHVLIVSSDHTFASVLERHLGTDFDVHAAVSDVAAFALLDSYAYVCVVVDLSARSVAGSATVSTLRLNALTIPIVALVPTGVESVLLEHAVAIVNDTDPIPRLAAAVRSAVKT
jgi:ActR/RegA family two-component response regulator